MVLFEGYGHNTENFVSKVVKESAGAFALREVNTRFESVAIGLYEGKHYIAASDISRIMENTLSDDTYDTVCNIMNVNKLNLESTVVVIDNDDTFMEQELINTGIMVEASSEDNAMNIGQAMALYSKFLKQSKRGKGSKEDLKDTIDVLKKCVSDMKKAIQTLDKDSTSNYGKTERIKYVLKTFIPFNNIYRLIERNDIYAGLAMVGGLAVSVLSTITGIYLPLSGAVEMGIRFAKYKDMIQDKIDDTNEAITYLEDKLKNFDKENK